MSDAYLRTGRGGAGNFYSQKDVEDAVTKDKAEDIEAQNPPTTLPIDDNSTTPSTVPSTSGTYARSGRGGAGNFIPPSSSSTLPTTTTNTTSFPPTSTASKSSSGASKYSGRGGAGNWTESESVKRANEEQEQRRKEALESGMAQEIRASLPQQPARTYHLHAPGRGRKPEA